MIALGLLTLCFFALVLWLLIDYWRNEWAQWRIRRARKRDPQATGELPKIRPGGRRRF